MKRRTSLRSLFLTFSYQGILLIWTGIFFITIIDLFNFHNLSAVYLLAGILVALDFCLTFSWLFLMKKYAKWRVWFFAAVASYLGIGNFLVLASFIYLLIKYLSGRFYLSLPVIFVGKFLLLTAFIIGIYGIWKSYRITIKTYTVRLANLPAFWQGKKIVMFADTHLGNIRNLNFIKKIAAMVQKERPDIVLIPGDYFDGTPADFVSLAAPLADIKCKLGVFFCEGNHEEFNHEVPFIHALKKAGVRALSNSFMEIKGLQIIGVEFKSTRGAHNLRKVLNKISFDRSKPSILMRHVPSAFKVAEENNIRLMLCGHTHRAQVFPFNYWSKLIFKGYDYGLKVHNNVQVLTTSGAGTWGPPLRVGTQSEIVSIILEPAK